MSAIPELPENTATPEVPVKVPKKRGRKRKSEIALQQIEEFIETVPRVETLSRRGRPRKKVNYYELANPDNLEYPLNLETEISYFSMGEEDTKVKKRRVHSDSEGAKDEESLEQNSTANGSYEESVAGVVSNGKDMVTSESKEADISIDDEATNLAATTSTPNNKDKRYSYTGETVKMMNTLFNLFTDEKGAPESAEITSNTSSNSTGNCSTNGKRPYRKTSKKANTSEEDLDDGTGNVTCAICNTTLDKSLWSHHKQRYHNNLAWRVGDAPLDLNDQSFVMHTLNTLYKKKKPLYCDKCGAVKKSVVGFLSHRSQCLKSEEQLESVKIACEICGRKMLPVSMSTHLKMLHTNPTERVVSEKFSDDVPHKPLSTKRSAAKKAMRIIETVTKKDDKERYFTTNLDLGSQEFALELMQKELSETEFFECKFKCNCITTNLEDALKHLEECTEKPAEGFVCKRCLFIATAPQDIIYHVEVVHEVALENDNDNEESFVEKDSSRLPSFLRTVVRRTERVLFPQAFEWTLKFCEDNFSDSLFEHLSFKKSNWFLLSPDQSSKYLPKLNESCHVAYTKITSFTNVLKEDHSFKKYNLFESDIVENKLTLFCGGPISSLAWLPTPYLQEQENQILAVSVLNSPDEQYLTCENFQVNSAIQFWSFGALRNKEYSMEEPKLVFSLAHTHGPVWHMEWCPSGCYGDERMGLLAVAGSDAVVYIYSIPFYNPEKLGLFYEAKPVMKLLLQRPESPLLGGLKYYPSKISWSKASGHQYVCVGYTNGFVGLYNLKSDSWMLKFEDNDSIPCVLPYKCFQAHSHAVTALALYHLHGGCRWVLTGSFDRLVNIWDLDNYNYPITTVKKNIVTDGFWLTNWLCYATTCDEGSTTNYVTTMLKQVRDYLYDPNITLLCSHSTISSVSGSDWLNGVVHANTVGEIIALFPHQLLQFPEQQKVLKNKRMLFGYTQLLEKGKTPSERISNDQLKSKTIQNLSTKKVSAGVKLSKIKSDFDCDNLFVNEPVLYEEAEQKYALLFCDNRMKSYDDFPKTTVKQLTAFSKSYGCMHPNQYPLTTINKIVFNPNRQASLYYATGYQAGFVRISWMEFLKGDHQVK